MRIREIDTEKQGNFIERSLMEITLQTFDRGVCSIDKVGTPKNFNVFLGGALADWGTLTCDKRWPRPKRGFR